MEQPSQLELEFRSLHYFITKEIEAKIDLALSFIGEAASISEQYGIPFRAYVSPLSQYYVPGSYNERFSGLDTSIVEELSNLDSWQITRGGWERSAIC